MLPLAALRRFAARCAVVADEEARHLVQCRGVLLGACSAGANLPGVVAGPGLPAPAAARVQHAGACAQFCRGALPDASGFASLAGGPASERPWSWAGAPPALRSGRAALPA